MFRLILAAVLVVTGFALTPDASAHGPVGFRGGHVNAFRFGNVNAFRFGHVNNFNAFRFSGYGVNNFAFRGGYGFRVAPIYAAPVVAPVVSPCQQFYAPQAFVAPAYAAPLAVQAPQCQAFFGGY